MDKSESNNQSGKSLEHQVLLLPGTSTSALTCKDVNMLDIKLNEEQRKAVESNAAQTLVLSGAGSGKTRVIVARIQRLINSGVSPSKIIALSYSKKASDVLKKRLTEVIDKSLLENLYIGTLHSYCYRILISHLEQVQLTANFTLLEDGDIKDVILTVLNQLKLDENDYTISYLQKYIREKKLLGILPNDVKMTDKSLQFDEIQRKIYQEYENYCKENKTTDYAGLLLKTYKLLTQEQDVLTTLRQTITHVLVDEFQDTNALQFKLLQLINTNLFVVGDDDQLIYGFQQACADNILKFKDTYPQAQVFTLQANYRSAANLLKAAKTLIENNTHRYPKNLESKSIYPEEIPITVYHALDEQDEAAYIIQSIESFIQTTIGYTLSDIAILCRTGQQLKVIEQELLKAAIPYQTQNNYSLLELPTIKDVLALLQLSITANDDNQMRRIIEFPEFGIDYANQMAIKSHSERNNSSLYDTLCEIVNNELSLLKGRLELFYERLTKVLDKIETASTNNTDNKISEQVNIAIDCIKKIYEATPELTNKLEPRYQQLAQLKTFITHFVKRHPQADLNILMNYITMQKATAMVQLMTIHRVKAEEYQTVFITGLEENLLPHRLSLNASTGIEDERRLLYVGMTRAKQMLSLSYASTRTTNGQILPAYQSRFLNELPNALLNRIESPQLTARLKEQKQPQPFVLEPQDVSDEYLTTKQFAQRFGIEERVARRILSAFIQSRKVPWRGAILKVIGDVQQGYKVAKESLPSEDNPVKPFNLLQSKDKSITKDVDIKVASGVFIDWVRCSQTFEPGVLPEIRGGCVMRMNANNEIETSTNTFYEHEGSFDTKIVVRTVGNRLEISGNPGRFGRPDNVFGYNLDDCVTKINQILQTAFADYKLPKLTKGTKQCVAAGIRKSAGYKERNKERYKLFITNLKERQKRGAVVDLRIINDRWGNTTHSWYDVEYNGLSFSRLDVTQNFSMEEYLSDFLYYLSTIKAGRLSTPRSHGSSVAFGDDSTNYSITCYDKAKELLAHNFEEVTRSNLYYGCLHNWLDKQGILRIELRLGRKYLYREHLQYYAVVTMNALEEIHREQKDMLMKDVTVPSSNNHCGLGEAAYRVFKDWSQGVNVRGMLSQPTFYRHSLDIRKATGFDIRNPYPLSEKPLIERLTHFRPMDIIKPAVPPDFYQLPPIDQSYAVG
jgi:DNA helicase-2/ATP-dependent DNA helicase PcrA